MDKDDDSRMFGIHVKSQHVSTDMSSILWMDKILHLE